MGRKYALNHVFLPTFRPRDRNILPASWVVAKVRVDVQFSFVLINNLWTIWRSRRNVITSYQTALCVCDKLTNSCYFSLVVFIPKFNRKSFTQLYLKKIFSFFTEVHFCICIMMKTIISPKLYSFTVLLPEFCRWKGKMKSLIFIFRASKYTLHFLSLIVKLLYFIGAKGIASCVIMKRIAYDTEIK